LISKVAMALGDGLIQHRVPGPDGEAGNFAYFWSTIACGQFKFSPFVNISPYRLLASLCPLNSWCADLCWTDARWLFTVQGSVQ